MSVNRTAVSMALQAGCQNVCSRSFSGSLLGRDFEWCTTGACQGEEAAHTCLKLNPTCRADTVLLLGSTASSSRTLCNASAGDAQVMLEELCRRTAMINHLSMIIAQCTTFP